MKVEPEAITVAVDAARDRADYENVGRYADEHGVEDYHQVVNWDEVIKAAVEAFLRSHPDLVADRIAREVCRRMSDSISLGKPSLHNIVREVIIDAFTAGVETA